MQQRMNAPFDDANGPHKSPELSVLDEKANSGRELTRDGLQNRSIECSLQQIRWFGHVFNTTTIDKYTSIIDNQQGQTECALDDAPSGSWQATVKLPGISRDRCHSES